MFLPLCDCINHFFFRNSKYLKIIDDVWILTVMTVQGGDRLSIRVMSQRKTWKCSCYIIFIYSSMIFRYCRYIGTGRYITQLFINSLPRFHKLIFFASVILLLKSVLTHTYFVRFNFLCLFRYRIPKKYSKLITFPNYFNVSIHWHLQNIKDSSKQFSWILADRNAY